MAGRLGAPGSHYSRCALGSYKLRGSFPHRQKGRQGSAAQQQIGPGRERTGLAPSSLRHPQDPICLGTQEEYLQSIDLVSKVLRVLTREGNLVWGSRKIKRKTIRHFFLDDMSALLRLRNGIQVCRVFVHGSGKDQEPFHYVLAY